ncbi:unnamed protein product, partial [Timema podura]|nr:unnamed protein product [Timema podura]
MNNMGQTPADQWAPPWAQLNGFNPKNSLGMEYTVLESYFDNIYQTKQDNTCPKSSHFESKSPSQTRSTNPTLPYGKTGFEADVPLSPINNKTIPKDNVCAKVLESEKNNFEISIAKPIGPVLQCPQEFSLELLGNLLPDVAIKEEPISLLENSRQQGPAISTDWDTQSASAHFDSLKVVSEHLVERIKLEDVCQSGSTYPFCLAQSSSNSSYPFGVPSQCQVNGFSQYSGDTSNSSKVPLSCHSGDKNFLLGNKDQGSGNFNLNMNNNLMCTTMFLMNESLQQNGAHQSHNAPRKHHDIFNIACEKGCNCEAANSIFRTGNGLMFAADKHAATKHFMTPCGPLQLTAQECGEFLLKKVASGNSLVNPDAAHINNQNASNESNTVQRKNRQTGVSGNTGVMHQGTSTENGGKLMPLPTGQKYRVAKERPFTCPECGKSFLLKHHLVTHARVHTGERPHICTECGKSFAHKHCLSTHLLLHSSDRPYKCMECKKSFTLKHHLVTHARVHSRDRPFVCQ